MSRNMFVLAVVSTFALIPLPAFSNWPECVPGELIVRFAPKADGEYPLAEEANTLVNFVCRGTVKGVSRYVAGSMLVKLPDNLSVEEAVSQFRNTPGVLYAQPNFIYRGINGDSHLS